MTKLLGEPVLVNGLNKIMNEQWWVFQFMLEDTYVNNAMFALHSTWGNICFQLVEQVKNEIDRQGNV